MSFTMSPVRAGWFCIILLIGSLAGCATAPPVQEMSDARQAIAAAKEAGAEQLAVEELGQAETMLQKAEEFLVIGTSNAYWQARNAAINAKETAFEALLTSRNARTPMD
jgi:hypothetical protein